MEKNVEMGKRFVCVCEANFGGDRKKMCAFLGWSPQYLNKLLNGESVGLNPVMSLLRKLPDINARWLLFGEGSMVDSGLGSLKSHLFGLLAIEKYLPVMTDAERSSVVSGNYNFPQETMARWESLLLEREQRIKAAMHP